MALSNSDRESIRIVAENLAPLTRGKDANAQHLAQQVIRLCNILTGDHEVTVDPKAIAPFDQTKAMARTKKAGVETARKRLASQPKKKNPKK